MKTSAIKFQGYYLLGVIFLLCQTVSAQSGGDFQPKVPDYIPSSPTAYELGKYGDIPVNESTGIANISIPLYTYSTPNLSVPISVSYATSGIKVSQVASWVGMGWNLNAGGVITREIRGMPDEDAQARSYPSYSTFTALKTSNPTLYYDTIKKMGDKDHTDYVADMFTFSVNGMSGNFFLDASLNPVIVKKESELKITKKTAYADGGFIITTPKGVKYTFDVVEETKQRLNCGNNPSYTQFKPTSWFLSKIEHPLGDVINFTYGNSTDYFYASSILETNSANDYAGSPPAGAPLPSEGVNLCTFDNYVKGKVLTAITSNRDVGSVTFTSSNLRPDLPDGSSREYQLDKITIKDPENNQIKELAFNYTDVESTVSYYGGSSPFPGANSNSEKYRLFLDDITEKDANGSSANGKKYSFTYEDRTSLPRRLSKSQDEFGYYNGKSNAGFLPDTEGTTSGDPFEYITKGDRSFSFAHAKKGILTKVTYPTKGYTEIEYESGVGSIRVKKIKALPKAGATEKITRYYYLSKDHAVAGTGTDTKVSFGVDDYIISRDARVTWEEDLGGGTYVQKWFDFTRIVFSSNGKRLLYSTNANKYLYSTVTVGYGDNFEGGGVEKLFRITADQPGTVVHGIAIIGGARSNDGYYNGELMEERYFKKNGSTAEVVKTTKYVYKEDATQEVALDNYNGEVMFENFYTPTDNSGYVIGYNIENIDTKGRWRVIDSVITKEYFGSGKIVETVEKRNYGTGLAGLPTEVITTDSQGNTRKTLTTYHTGTPYTTQHQIGIPKKVETYKGTDLLTTMEYDYFTSYGTNSLILPDKIKTLRGTENNTVGSSYNPKEDRIEFISYYDNGNAKEVEKTDGTQITYIWGYDGTKPIAKIENASFSDIPTSIYNSIQTACGNDVNGSTENTLRTELDKLRNASLCPNLSDAMVSTFTYDPLVGVTSITDPRGRTTYYYYDSFARLQYVKDHEGKIVNKTEYNYKN